MIQLAGLLKPRDLKPETSFDVILKAWLEHKTDQMPADLQKMLERWKQVNAMLRNGYVITKGDNQITRPYKYNELADYLVEYYQISYRTAYDDIANTKRFFLPVQSRDEKEFGRGVMIEWGERFMFEAASMGDYKSAGAFFNALAEIKGLKKDDPDRPDYENVILPHLVIVADPSELGFTKIENPDQVVKDILARRKKSKLDKLIAESDIAEYDTNSGIPEGLAE